jgi:DNA-binding NtrC family response regulator
MMIKEIGFMTDILNKKGLKEGDEIIIKPFGKRRRTYHLNHTKLIFTTKSGPRISWVKVLESIQGEDFTFELKRFEVPSINQQKNERYFLQSSCGTPFKLNGSFTMQAFVEVGDEVEFGFHKVNFTRRQSAENQMKLFSSCIEENERVISSMLPILLEGETGVGKTSLAREFHHLSGRKGRFIHINVSAFSSTLIESELFGHVKGAFTGALSDKKGAFRQSNQGTLFIDEIDSLPLELQTKLLLFFDSQELTPVGSEINYKIDTRIICASGRSLKSLTESKLMRKDFYFRVASGAIIKIPSLRDNIPMLSRFCKLYGIERNIIIPQKLIEFYETLPWPGNYRQLKGHLDKKFVMMNGRKMDFDDVDNELVVLSSELIDIENNHSITMKELKTNYAKKVYFECDQNYSRASMLLNISPRSLKGLIETDQIPISEQL